MRKNLLNGYPYRNAYPSGLFTHKTSSRKLSITVIGVGDKDTRLYSLKNDYEPTKPLQPHSSSEQTKPWKVSENYIKESFEKFNSYLKPKSLYILVEKAFLINDCVPWDGRGHITSFITDENCKVDNKLTVSLRQGVRIEEGASSKKLVFKMKHLNKPDLKEESISVTSVQFKPLEYELTKLLRESQSKYEIEKFLIELPLESLETSYQVLDSQTTALKKEFESKWFILCDGHINGKPYKALNCVTGFYGRFFLRSTELNPSPQMAAWSYLVHMYGLDLRDNLIVRSKLKDPSSKERLTDDRLESVTREELSSLNRFH